MKRLGNKGLAFNLIIFMIVLIVLGVLYMALDPVMKTMQELNDQAVADGTATNASQSANNAIYNIGWANAPLVMIGSMCLALVVIALRIQGTSGGM